MSEPLPREDRRVGLLGVPMDLGQGRRGVDMGPSAARYAGFQSMLEELGFSVEDSGNVGVPLPELAGSEDEPLWRLGAVRDVCTDVCGQVRETVSGGTFPVVLGGDHSISIGTVSGVAAANRVAGEKTGVIWLDAHADFNTPESSPSGNIHGMPLATLAGRGHPELVDIGGEGASIRAEDVVLIGLRSVDLQEQRLLTEAGATAYTMKEIDAYGIARVVRKAIENLSHLDRVHLSFDLDALDPETAPGVGTPVRGGLTYREAHLVMEMLNESNIVTSLDVVEINPILDAKNTTAELAVELVASLMGRRIIALPR
ncbi:arginase [Rubrobacter indicoceani]|uniref:arginase n=1 Tax=Rubrobacter indicoceani TaxID=2051957 RepID=UPI000E5B5D91|nr:arginase [Rubrobacter indicoceani]